MPSQFERAGQRGSKMQIKVKVNDTNLNCFKIMKHLDEAFSEAEE